MFKFDEILGQIDPNGCQDIPMLQSATQTYFDYVNGASGYAVLAVGVTALVLGIFGRKWMAQVPGWLSGAIIFGLAIGSLPLLLNAMGVQVGCGGGGGSGVVNPPASTVPADAAEDAFGPTIEVEV